MKFRLTTALAAVAVAALSLSGCATPGPDGDSQGTGSGTLTLSSTLAPTTFDPAGSAWGNAAPYYQAVFDTLLLATTEGTIEPFLATDYSYNDDNTVLTLTIREGVTFSDGSELTPDVVAQNLLRFRDGTSPDAGYFSGVQSVEATDGATVVITLAAPDPAFLNYLTRDGGLVASAESFDSPDIDTDPVGSGPYILDTDATVSGSTYTYTANPDYWNKDLQHYDTLVIRKLDDPTATLNSILAGEVNGARLANNDSLDQVEGAGWNVVGNELDFVGILLLDREGTLAPELADVRVRQAINFAFDRESLLQTLGAGLGTVTTQVFPERSAAFDPELDEYYTYDPERARELLAEAGYPDGFTLSMPSLAALGQLFTLFAQQLGDIGITVEYTDPGSNFLSDVLAPKFPASFASLEQNPDWQLIQFMVAPNAVFNPFGAEDPVIDQLMTDIQYGDEATQAEKAHELNRYLVEQAWFVPMYRSQGSFAVDSNTDVVVTPTNIYPAIYNFTPAA